MELRNREDIFNLQLKVQNLVQLGSVLETKGDEVLVKFSEDCALWLQAMTLKSGLSFPLEKGETVLVICPFGGDLTEAVVWGSLSKNQGGGFRVVSKNGFSFSNGKEEILELLVEALKIIASSKTPTLMGVQASVDNSTKLPQIMQKLESMTC